MVESSLIAYMLVDYSIIPWVLCVNLTASLDSRPALSFSGLPTWSFVQEISSLSTFLPTRLSAFILTFTNCDGIVLLFQA